MGRADSSKEHMGLTSWEDSPNGKILKSDATFANNYLTKDELSDLGRIVNSFLDLAEDFAKRKVPMTMEDWSKRLNMFLELTGRGILKGAGNVLSADAKAFAESE